MPILPKLLFGAFFIALAGCASQPATEQQKYAKLQDGIKYNSYRKLSKVSIGAAVDAYNYAMEQEGKPKATKSYVYAVSGFVWSMVMQPDFAIADTNTALKRNDSNKARYISLATQSMAFYQKGWHQLGRQYGDQAKALMADGEVGRKFDKEQQISHIVLGSLAMYNGDTILAQSSFEILGESFDKPWLPHLARAVAGFNKGGFSESIRIIRGLQNEKHLSNSEKILLAGLKEEMSSLAEKEAFSNVSLKPLLTKIVYQSFIESSDGATKKLAESIRDFHDNVKL